MGLYGPDKYLSLYRLEHYSALKHIEGWPRVDLGNWDPILETIHPAALEDWYHKERMGLADMGKYTFTGGATPYNPEDQGHWGWRQLAGTELNQPFLNTSRCIATELVKVSESSAKDWITWYKNDYFPRIRNVDGVVDTALFGITTTGKPFEPGYRYITICELDSLSDAETLSDRRSDDSGSELLVPAGTENYPVDLAERIRVNIYSPISRHWAYEK